MSKYFLALQKVHETVHDFELFVDKTIVMKKKFSEPKIYTGGVEIKDWNKLKKSEKDNALSKEWYVYYSFRQDDGKLKRMPNVKAGANRYSSKLERYEYLKTIQKALLFLLQKGLNPYENNDLSVLSEKQINNSKVTNPKIGIEKIIANKNEKTIKEAIDYALKIKKSVLATNNFKNLENRIQNFSSRFKQDDPISSIDKNSVMLYLNDILIKNSPRTRNNHRTDLSSIFQVLEDSDIININFVKRLPVLKTNPEKNKTYTPKEEKEIFDFLNQNDPILLLYIKFISYNFLRPVEVNRLKIKDIDILDKKLYVKTKNKPLKIKIIPDILIKELPDLTFLNKENYLFTPNGLGLEWNADENNRRDNFSKRFKNVVKEKFNLGTEYGLYSFRHTFITKLYRKLRQDKSPFEAKSFLMTITGHTTMNALEKYLRDIDAELPDDYSNLFK